MSEVKQFRLPDVGEGLTEADIVSWHVKPGDAVKVNQIIVEIETAKAVVELPSPYEGIVTGLLVEEGANVPVGSRWMSRQLGTARPPAPGSMTSSHHHLPRRRSSRGSTGARHRRRSGRRCWSGTA